MSIHRWARHYTNVSSTALTIREIRLYKWMWLLLKTHDHTQILLIHYISTCLQACSPEASHFLLTWNKRLFQFSTGFWAFVPKFSGTGNVALRSYIFNDYLSAVYYQVEAKSLLLFCLKPLGLPWWVFSNGCIKLVSICIKCIYLVA